jgi:hypothetical protein
MTPVLILPATGPSPVGKLGGKFAGGGGGGSIVVVLSLWWQEVGVVWEGGGAGE